MDAQQFAEHTAKLDRIIELLEQRNAPAVARAEPAAPACNCNEWEGATVGGIKEFRLIHKPDCPCGKLPESP